MNGEELQKAVKNSGVKVEDILEKTGIKERTFFSLYKKEEIDKHYLDKIEGAGVVLQKTAKLEGKVKNVPYYDIDATAGNVTIFAEDGAEYIKEYISVPAFSDCEMYLNVSGSSMYPKYCSGELIALKKLTDFEVVAYGEAYLIVTREQRLLKYIKKSTQKNMWALHSEHKDYEPFDIHVAKVLHLYIIKGKITKNII